MTQISAYGIGAGRAISGESEGDEERLRQRRVTAAQRAEQEKRGAAVRERLARAQAADTLISEQQLAQRMQADARSREVPVGARQKSPAFPAATRSAPSHVPLATSLPKPRQPSDKPIESLPLRVPIDSPPEDAIPAKPLPLDVDIRDRALSDDKPTETAVPVNLLADSDSRADVPPVQRFTCLIDEVSDLRGEHFSDMLTARLNDIASSIRSQPELFEDPADTAMAMASLDFLEGYVEAAHSVAADQQKILQLITDLRRQLVESGLSPQLPQLMVSALVATQIPADRSRVAGVTDARGQGRQRPSATQRNAAADPDDEAESSLLAAGAQLMQQSSAVTVKPSKSSLSKDAEKRREETLISVTVRSV